MIIVAVKCQQPLKDQMNGPVIVNNFMKPAIVGSNITFDCPPEHVLIGPNTTTCMGNGEWEPDPREAECKGIIL